MEVFLQRAASLEWAWLSPWSGAARDLMRLGNATASPRRFTLGSFTRATLWLAVVILTGSFLLLPLLLWWRSRRLIGGQRM